MTPLFVFLGSLVADYSTSWVAIRRGLREGNPVLRANPVIVSVLSAGVVIGLAEGFRAAGYAGWQGLYYVGAGVHFAASIWNAILILRKGR